MKIIKPKDSPRIFHLLLNSLTGFTAFLLVVFTGELISSSTWLKFNFEFDIIHFQIAALGAILQASVYLIKSVRKSP